MYQIIRAKGTRHLDTRLVKLFILLKMGLDPFSDPGRELLFADIALADA